MLYIQYHTVFMKMMAKEIKKTIKIKQAEAFEALKGHFGYKNKMEVPRFVKVVISVGTGSFKDKKKLEVVADRLAKITGQKAAPRAAKKSIASFKVREGDPIGYQVTLRGPRMHGFLDKFLGKIGECFMIEIDWAVMPDVFTN